MKQTFLVILVTALTGCGGSAVMSKAKAKAYEIKCRGNLEHIAQAIMSWAEENNKDVTGKVSLDDIQSELGPAPKCEAGGKYILTTVQEAPTCSFKGHSLKKDFTDDFYSEVSLKSIRDNYLRAQEKD